jgi:undecaprenyl-diphosphatase
MDSTILTWINGNWTHPWLDWLMVVLSTVGLAWCGLLTLWVWRQEDRRLGSALFVGQIVALVGVLLLYWLAARTRPDAVRLVMVAPPLPSFPSGHAALATATATVWWLHNGWNRRTALMVLLAVGVAYSRVYLGHHFPSDVLAGIVWGLGSGAAAHGLTHDWGNRRRMVSWLLWPQVSLALVITFMAYLGLIPYFLLTWPFADKALHMLLIGSLAFWLNLWLPDLQLAYGRLRVPVAIVLPFALAAVEEGLQSYSPRRTFDLGDLVSDLVGLLLFYALSRWVSARLLTPKLVEEG